MALDEGGSHGIIQLFYTVNFPLMYFFYFTSDFLRSYLVAHDKKNPLVTQHCYNCLHGREKAI